MGSMVLDTASYAAWVDSHRVAPDPRWMGVILLGWILIYMITFTAVPYLIGDTIWNYFSKGGMPKQLGLVSRIGSTVHAIIVVIFSMVAIFKEEGLLSGNVVHTSSAIISWGCYVSVPYLLVDALMVIKIADGKWKSQDVQDVIHHMVTMNSELSMLYFGGYGYVTVFLLLTEVTTPLLNLRWWLLERASAEAAAKGEGEKRGEVVAVTYVSVCLMLGFIIFRVANCFHLCLFYWYARSSVLEAPGPLSFALLSILVVLTILNSYWLSLMLKMAVARFFGDKKTAKRN